MATVREEKFCIGVSEGLTQSDAYRQAGYAFENMNNQGIAEAAYRVAIKPHNAARIEELLKIKREAAEKAFSIDISKLLETYFLIAFTDPNELMQVRKGCCRYCHGEGFGYQWREREYLAELSKWNRKPNGDMPDIAGGFGFLHTRDPHPECVECGGEGETRLVAKDSTKLSPGAKMLYQGAQQTKDGLKILFADKNAALERIGRMLGAFDDRLRVDLKGAVASMQLTTSDPIEAAREYEKMLAGGGK